VVDYASQSILYRYLAKMRAISALSREKEELEIGGGSIEKNPLIVLVYNVSVVNTRIYGLPGIYA
jgi:hypothetical protein